MWRTDGCNASSERIEFAAHSMAKTPSGLRAANFPAFGGAFWCVSGPFEIAGAGAWQSGCAAGWSRSGF